MNGDSEAIPLPGEIWERQSNIRRLRTALGDILASQSFQFRARMTAGSLGCFMIMFPIFEFFRYLRAGILLLSPPLALMFCAGFVGLGLMRTANAAPNIELPSPLREVRQ